MRISVVMLRLKPAFFHYIENVTVNFFLGYDVMNSDRFRNDISDRHSRRQRRIRILEDKLNIRAVFLHFLAADVRYIFALEENLPAVRLIKFENGSSERGFSAT